MFPIGSKSTSNKKPLILSFCDISLTEIHPEIVVVVVVVVVFS